MRHNEILLTDAEKGIVEWALDPMGDYFSEIEREDVEIPTIKGNILQLGDRIATEDLLYRLVVQLDEMGDGLTGEEKRKWLNDKNLGLSVAKKIYRKTGINTAHFNKVRDFLDRGRKKN